MKEAVASVGKVISLLCCIVVLSACAPTQQIHGFVPSRSEVESIVPGVDTIFSIESNLGQPSSAGLVDGRGWYYVATTIENFTYNPPRVVDRTVVAVLFDGDGVVEAVNSYGLDDGRIVNLDTRITATNGRTLGVVEQIFGNIGRITTADLVN